jgi:hypothetical protein
LEELVASAGWAELEAKLPPIAVSAPLPRVPPLYRLVISNTYRHICGTGVYPPGNDLR